MASNFAFTASLVWWRTNFFTSLSKPISLSDLLSNDVNIVTPIILVSPETFLAAFNAFNPELMWIVI